MALFGFGGYNAKTYAKNTDLLKARLGDLMMKTMSFRGVGTTLNTAMIKLTEYPAGANNKHLEAIDARIFQLIDKMMQDIQTESAGKLSGHANMLLTAITKSRAYGQEAYPPEQLKAQEMMAECNANIEEHLVKKESIAREMEAIKNKAKKIAAENPNAIELQRMQLKYAELNKELKRVEQNLQLWVTQYNNTVSQLKVMEDGAIYTEISATDLQTHAQFAHHVEQVSAQLNKLVETQSGIADIASGYEGERESGVQSVATADDGGFWAAISSENGVNDDIFGSTANARETGNSSNSAPTPAWFDN